MKKKGSNRVHADQTNTAPEVYIYFKFYCRWGCTEEIRLLDAPAEHLMAIPVTANAQTNANLGSPCWCPLVFAHRLWYSLYNSYSTLGAIVKPTPRTKMDILLSLFNVYTPLVFLHPPSSRVMFEGTKNFSEQLPTAVWQRIIFMDVFRTVIIFFSSNYYPVSQLGQFFFFILQLIP